MPRFKPLQNTLPALILVLSLIAIYLSTMAPGLSWANRSSDGGDLITAAATAGVPHPTGYPLYVLVARVFQWLPVGSLALRTNLLSALATALAAALVYGLVNGLTQGDKEDPAWPAALAAGYAFGLAPLVWSQAVITEVYGLQAFLVALILFLYTRPEPTPVSPAAETRLDLWRGLTLGLAMGNHLTTILLVPAAFVLGSMRRGAQPQSLPDRQRSWPGNLNLDRGAFLRQLGMFGAGLSVYLIIPLHALANPPVNWGNAVTLQRFWWLVSGQLYQSYYLQFSLAGAWERMQASAELLLEQFGLPGVTLALIGLIVFGRRSRLHFLTMWAAGVSIAFTLVYGSDDSFVYLIPVLLSFALWIGQAIVGLTKPFSRWSSLLRIVFAFLLTGYLAGQSMTHFHELDASGDDRAESYGREVLSAAPEHAIVFAKGDRAVFTLWYFHFALGERPDLAVVAEDLLHFDWYQENLRATYPALLVPGPFPWPETLSRANPSRAVCYTRYSDRIEINCSPARIPR